MSEQGNDMDIDNLVPEVMNYLPNVGIDWEPMIRKQIYLLSDIDWNVRYRGCSQHQALAQARDPLFIAYRTCIFEYFGKGLSTGKLTVSRWFNRMIQRLNERRQNRQQGEV